MITETEARDLLARAAETIEVPATAPVVPAQPRRARWIAPVAAAAAIAAAVGAGVVLIHHQDRPDQPGPVAPTPTPDPYAGSVPPVFAYDGDSAQNMLESRGLHVERKQVTNRCETPDRALRTKPGTGFPVEPGDTVTLYTTGPLVNACNPTDQLAWQILDFANGRGPQPRIAPDAKFYINGSPSTPKRSFVVISSITRLPWGGEPVLRARQLSSPVSCPTDDGSIPEQFAGRGSYWLSVAPKPEPMDGVFGTLCGLQMNIFFNGANAIDAVLIQASPSLIHPPKELLQRTERIATARLPFINFARGRVHHLFGTTSIELYSEGAPVRIVGKDDISDRSAYSLCPDSKSDQVCMQSPLLLLGRLTAAPTVSERADCFVGRGILPHVSGQATVLLTEPKVPPCESRWTVQLEYDSDYKLVAINTFEGPN